MSLMKGQGGRVAKETLEELKANTTAKGREQGPRSKDEKILLPMEGWSSGFRRGPGMSRWIRSAFATPRRLNMVGQEITTD